MAGPPAEFGAPRLQAAKAVAAAIGLGWRPHLLHRRAIVLDMETTIDPGFVTLFADQCHGEGFSCWPYGSTSSIYSDPSADGYWVAQWDDLATLSDHPKALADQFAADVSWEAGRVDLSALSAEGLLHLGRGPRHSRSSS